MFEKLLSGPDWLIIGYLCVGLILANIVISVNMLLLGAKKYLDVNGMH